MLDFEGKLLYHPVIYLKALPKEHRGEQPQLGLGLACAVVCAQVTSSPAQVNGTAHTERGCSGCGFAVSTLKHKLSKPPPQKSPSLPHQNLSHGSVVSLVRVDFAIKLHHQLLQEKH